MEMTTPTYRYSDHYTASFKTVRDLNTALRNDLLPKTGGIITGDIFLVDETDPQNALATKQYVLDNAGAYGDFLPLAGGTVTGNVFLLDDTDPLNAFATKQYVLDNAGGGGGGGGGGGEPDLIQTADTNTRVKCEADGVKIEDDGLAILTISKHPTLPTTVLRNDQQDLQIYATELLVTNHDNTQNIFQANITGLTAFAPVSYNTGIVATDPSHLITRGLTESLILSAKNSVSELVDANTGEDPVTDAYRLRIDQNRLQFFNGAQSDDPWLKLFASSTTGSDGVIQQTNRSNFYLESEDTTSNLNSLFLRHTFNGDPGSVYQTSAPLRLQQGKEATFPFARISAMNLLTGGTNSSINLTPKNTLTAGRSNYVEPTLRMGYSSTADLATQNYDSILKRSENDSRYYLNSTTLDQILEPTGHVSMANFVLKNLGDPVNGKDAVSRLYADGRYYLNTTRLDQIVVPQTSVNFNNQKILNVGAPTLLTDGVNYGSIYGARLGYTQIRKTTNTQTVNQPLTGWALSSENNSAQNAYYDPGNNGILVTVATNDPVRIKFTLQIFYTISATGNTSTYRLRYLSDSSFLGPAVVCANQNYTGSFSYTLVWYQQFTANQVIYVVPTAYNGSPPFSALDVVFTAENQFMSNAINALRDSTNASTLEATSAGFTVVEPGRYFFLNGMRLIGSANTNVQDTDFDEVLNRAQIEELIAFGGSEPTYYTVVVNVGDVPSGVESFSSTNNKVTSVTYTQQSTGQGFYTVNFNTAPFLVSDYEVMVSIKSLRTGNPSTIDNDIAVPFVSNIGLLGFNVTLEETGSVVQNVAIVMMIIRAP